MNQAQELELEPTPSQRREMAMQVLERVLDHLDTLGQQPSIGPMEDIVDRCRALREAPPEAGTELDSLLASLFDEYVPRSFNAAAPSYMAYVPGGGLFAAALADFIAASVNRFTGVWNAAPLLVQLEANALDWIRDWMGFPASAKGLLTTGGSMATFAAVVAAREAKLGTELRRGTLYASREAHSCILKAARLAGVLEDRVRTIDVDAEGRMRMDLLATAIETDAKAGLLPFFVASSAGTVTTGAIDPMMAIAELCRQKGLWHHVDGAYGGFFYLLPEMHARLEGFASADSLVLDPHKGLFLPFGTGALLVKDGELLKAAHDWHAGYLPPLPDPEFYNPCQYGPDLSRDFKGLRLWLPLKLYGIERFREALREKVALAHRAHAALAEVAELEVSSPPELSLFTFRMRWDGASSSALDEATRALLDRVTKRGRAFLSGAEVHGRFVARFNVLSFRTHQDRVDEAVQHVREEAAALAAQA